MPGVVVVKVRSRDFLELMIGYGLIMIVVWTPNPWQRALFWIAFAWIASSTIYARENLDNLGLRVSWKLSNFMRAALVVATAAALAAIAVWISIQAHTMREHYGPVSLLSRVWGYILWSFVQQFILQAYFLTRLIRLLPNRAAAVVVAAAMFSAAHLPNPVLTVATLIWGLVACALFLRYREIYSLGAVHAILGLCVAFTIPNAIHHHMRVGLGYLYYHRHYSETVEPSHSPRKGMETTPAPPPANSTGGQNKG